MARVALALLLITSLTIIPSQVHSSIGIPLIDCKTDKDCQGKPYSYCKSVTCDCIHDAIKLSSGHCLPPTQPRAGPVVAELKAADSKKQSSDEIVPDWALYGAVCFGLIGMGMVVVEAARRHNENEGAANRRAADAENQTELKEFNTIKPIAADELSTIDVLSSRDAVPAMNLLSTRNSKSNAGGAEDAVSTKNAKSNASEADEAASVKNTKSNLREFCANLTIVNEKADGNVTEV